MAVVGGKIISQFEGAALILSYIYHHPKCTSREIYDALSDQFEYSYMMGILSRMRNNGFFESRKTFAKEQMDAYHKTLIYRKFYALSSAGMEYVSKYPKYKTVYPDYLNGKQQQGIDVKA